MGIFDQLRNMKTRTYFLIFTPPAIIGFVLLFTYCLNVYGDICFRTPMI